MEEKRRWVKKKCVDCGKEFIATEPKSVRCFDCRLVYNEDNPDICKKAKTCYYGGDIYSFTFCDYLTITGVRRPCKAGECVMYKRKEK